VSEPATATKVKLSYKEQRAYDALPAEIESIETELEALNDQISHADFYQKPNDEVQATLKALEEKESELETLFERWEVLESKVMGG
jgi:ATP-binding cassette subfamily F protein uup